ncbi:protoheme IX farnesyltransferase [candidate division KSB1 bacterium]|nr:protoheme IX farnesyltransferase [candidate division KSB1 bacterium]NIR69317.1 protoheme IX farnesyltransferase [candidate division KSB1 bacterium]NIS22723.1 protoheme IX farnesyltransferase [candidate division KSB1 bacterium]NIT69569.1 protoheme IX farnesyltransferase [candidate division KSB1 bacterium]NIU23223.1 protoheme IX farnesyltransferase [candidate division KSB1 bacterium]
MADYWELTKPGVTFMVIISTLGGFYLATQGSLDFLLLFNTLLGTWLVAGGTNALNQLIEHENDARMKRTRKRPLPAGRLQSGPVILFSLAISILGILHLSLSVNSLTGLLAALTLGSYIFIYTPLKRKNPLSTIVGAVPGALPAMGGWVAVRGAIDVESWVLFAILFFWQLPHFLAIAWIYREDYARGGFPVLPVLDRDGAQTSLHIVFTCLALLSVSLLPTLMGLTGTVYFLGALILGLAFLISGVRVALLKTNRYAKQLLHASIIYLPVLMALMFIDKAPM